MVYYYIKIINLNNSFITVQRHCEQSVWSEKNYTTITRIFALQFFFLELLIIYTEIYQFNLQL